MTASLRDRLTGTRFVDTRVVARTGSTNSDLVEEAGRGAGEQALIADVQDAGRGRRGRTWEAPPGASLLMSVLVRPPFPAGGPHLLGVALGVAAVEAVRDVADLTVGLKWPNDIVTVGSASQSAGPTEPDRKLGGLLAEFCAAGPGHAEAAVLGIGVNLEWSNGFPEQLAMRAASIDQLGVTVDRDDLAVAILRRLDARGRMVDEAAVRALLEDYRRCCVTLGRPVRVALPEGELTGTAADVAADATLVLRDDHGRTRNISAGDVVHLRPAE